MSIIELKNVSIYQKEKLILSNLNFSIGKGEFVFLIGKVGSGKSSLLKTIYADLPLLSGDIEVCGFNISKITSRSIPYLRRKLGIIFQDFQILSDRNIHDNLEFALKVIGKKSKSLNKLTISDTLKKVDMVDKDQKMPHELSGGELQRIAIARAIINAQEIIIADEPTGNLDAESSIKVMEIFKNLCSENKTVFVATHNYDIVKKYATRVLKIELMNIIELHNIDELN